MAARQVKREGKMCAQVHPGNAKQWFRTGMGNCQPVGQMRPAEHLACKGFPLKPLPRLCSLSMYRGIPAVIS